MALRPGVASALPTDALPNVGIIALVDEIAAIIKVGEPHKCHANNLTRPFGAGWLLRA